MHQRVIPSSQETLPVIGLGTYQTFNIGNTNNEREQLKEILKTISPYKGAVIDSSPMYGKSEEVIGDLLHHTGLTGKFFLATKVWTTGREEGIREMNRSFKRMRTSCMDLMQIHNLVDWKTHLPVLNDWKAQGKIRYTGITHYHEGAYKQVEQVLQQEQFDFLQINYSIRRREAEERLLPLAAEKGVAVIINQPFEAGALFSLVKNKKLPDFAIELDCTSWAEYFIKFILANPHVTCVIPATSNTTHLHEFLKAGEGKLPDEKLKKQMIEYIKK